MSVHIDSKRKLVSSNTCSNIQVVVLRYPFKTELTLKLGIGIYFLKFFMSLKKVLEMFLKFSVMGRVEIKFNQAAFWKMRELPFTYTVCQLIVSEKRCRKQDIFKF